ncbi:hypothetical protein SLS60_000096 [Paraconiothyrium brasiliense]|uniref:Peptidase C19 ubiquitin carboxyl-terminal hydrolase domain-containing protein n=1 Tax=Paraconiothyrium brasiliense TaxID=300254 RepID=A0ABR3S596_9PLEO
MSYQVPVRKRTLGAEDRIGGVVSKPHRLAPKALKTNAKNYSHSNAVLQALATAVDATWLQLKLGSYFVGPSLEVDETLTATEIEESIKSALWSDDDATQVSVNPVAELLRVLVNLQTASSAQSPMVNAYALQFMMSGLSTDPSPDPVSWLELVLESLSIGHPGSLLPEESDPEQHPLIKGLLEIQEVIEMVCRGPKCGKGPNSPKLYEQQTSWGYAVEHPLDHNGRMDNPECPITEMIKKRVFNSAKMEHYCKRCKGHVAADGAGLGFDVLPQILIIELMQKDQDDFTGKKAVEEEDDDDEDPVRPPGRRMPCKFPASTAKLTALEDTLDLTACDLTRGPSTSPMYQLQSVIKRVDLGDGDIVYSTFTRASDNIWWECEDEVVSEATSEEARSLVHEKRPCLLFYEKVQQAGPPVKKQRLHQ